MRRPGNRAVDASEMAAGRGFMFPDFGRYVGRFTHEMGLMVNLPRMT